MKSTQGEGEFETGGRKNLFLRFASKCVAARMSDVRAQSLAFKTLPRIHYKSELERTLGDLRLSSLFKVVVRKAKKFLLKKIWIFFSSIPQNLTQTTPPSADIFLPEGSKDLAKN